MMTEQGWDGRIWIRSSSLGNFAACPRHYIANREPEETLMEAHPDFVKKERPGGYKTVLGTAFHYCMENDIQDEAEIAKAVAPILRKGLEKDPENFYDKSFTEIGQMVETVQKMVGFFRDSSQSREWTSERDGNRYEVFVQSDKIDSGINFTGNIDCVRQDGVAVDLKTADATDDKNLHLEQLTAYRLLLDHAEGIKSHSHAEVVKVYRPRSPNSRPSSMKTARYRIDTSLHEERVIQIVKDAATLVDQRDKWKNDFTLISANPASKACTYCILRNSPACPETQGTEL